MYYENFQTYVLVEREWFNASHVTTIHLQHLSTLGQSYFIISSPIPSSQIIRGSSLNPGLNDDSELHEVVHIFQGPLQSGPNFPATSLATSQWALYSSYCKLRYGRIILQTCLALLGLCVFVYAIPFSWSVSSSLLCVSNLSLPFVQLTSPCPCRLL